MILIHLGAKKDHVQNLRTILLLFEAVSSLINLQKSKIMGVGEVANFVELASITGFMISIYQRKLWGCTIASLPTLYFGLALGAKYRSRSICN